LNRGGGRFSRESSMLGLPSATPILGIPHGLPFAPVLEGKTSSGGAVTRKSNDAAMATAGGGFLLPCRSAFLGRGNSYCATAPLSDRCADLLFLISRRSSRGSASV
jgi:hypothetical protein